MKLTSLSGFRGKPPKLKQTMIFVEMRKPNLYNIFNFLFSYSIFRPVLTFCLRLIKCKSLQHRDIALSILLQNLVLLTGSFRIFLGNHFLYIYFLASRTFSLVHVGIRLSRSSWPQSRIAGSNIPQLLSTILSFTLENCVLGSQLSLFT